MNGTAAGIRSMSMRVREALVFDRKCITPGPHGLERHKAVQLGVTKERDFSSFDPLPVDLAMIRSPLWMWNSFGPSPDCKEKKRPRGGYCWAQQPAPQPPSNRRCECRGSTRRTSTGSMSYQ
jgi:hypothetical protein